MLPRTRFKTGSCIGLRDPDQREFAMVREKALLADEPWNLIDPNLPEARHSFRSGR